MENIYSGENSVTEYLRVKIKTLINYIAWAFLLLIILCALFSFLIVAIIDVFNYKYDELFGHQLAVGLFLSLAAVVFIAIILTIVLITVEILRTFKTNKEIHNYMNIKITNVNKVLIDYDTKEWLTAPKNTYHPLSFHLDVNSERLNLKTQPIFTNSSSYCHLPRHKMPSILQNKNYINNYALVGYYEALNEGIIIKIIKE